MPGHHVGDALKESVEKDVSQLIEHIDSHDVVFLLTDTRESRWLPTMLCAFKGKVSPLLFAGRLTTSEDQSLLYTPVGHQRGVGFRHLFGDAPRFTTSLATRAGHREVQRCFERSHSWPKPRMLLLLRCSRSR